MRVSIGAGTFLNYDCLMLDVAQVTIGADCQVATRVQFITATHPIDPSRAGSAGSRRSRSWSATTSGWAPA